MIRLIIEKELREIIGDAKFVYSFAICALLIILAFYSGAKNYQINVTRYDASKRENIRQMEGITDWKMVRQTKIFLPPLPLASLVTGVSNDIGQTVAIQGRGGITAQDSRFGDNPVSAVFRFLDLEFIFQIVLTLFAILFAYDAVSGEKERGTLRLTFSNGVPRASYLFGKVTGSFLALTVPLLIPFLIGALLFTQMGAHLTGDEWVRLGLIVLTGFMLFGVFLTLSVFVSSLTHRSGNSFLILLIVWVFAVMVVPRVSALLMGSAVDVPSAEYLASLEGRFNAQLWNDDRIQMADYKPAAGDSMDQMMNNFQKFMENLSDQRDKKLSEYSAKLDEDRGNKLDRQTKLSLGLARVSPGASFSLAASTLAGTSLSLKQVFQDQAKDYQQSFGKFMVEKTGVNIGGGMVMQVIREGGEKPKPINPYELPEFTFKHPKLSEQFAAVVPEWGILIVCMLVFFAGSFIAFLRYDLR